MKKELVKFLVLLMVALGAGPVGAAFWQWSTNAASNATADPSINWAEGMAPSAVNDSARAMMAALAVRSKDSGSIASAGTASAFTLTTNTGYPSIAALNGQMITFQNGSGVNTAGATITIDGNGPYPLTTDSGASIIPAGTMVIGGMYTVSCVSFNSVCNIVGVTGNPFNIPLGGIMWSTLTTAPSANFVAPSGQCISTTTYAAYWVALGSPASGICSGGQFQLIDMRGRVAAALDTLNASAASRLTSSATGCGTAMTSVGAVCSNGVEGFALTLAQIPSHTHANTLFDPQHSHGIKNAALNGTPTGMQDNSQLSAGPNSGLTQADQASRSVSTGITITNAAQGGGGAHPTVQPTIGLIPYLRVL